MGLPASRPTYSITEYIRREQGSVDKHEYRDGKILLMAGGSGDHSTIAINTYGLLWSRLRGKPCRVYNSDLRIRIPRKVLYTYPDASIICGPREPDPDDPSGETFTNPKVLIEILSPSTEVYDRGEKFDRYRLIGSLEEYVLISQSMPKIEIYLRQPDGAWLFTVFTGLEATAHLRSVGVDLSLSDIYDGVTLRPADELSDSAQ